MNNYNPRGGALQNIITLAQEEAAAASSKNKADAKWRKTWWDLTIALGQLPKTGSGEQIKKVAEIVGQSIGGVNGRRQLGGRVLQLALQNIHGLPPRMMLAIPVSQFNLETVELAREAEADGMSLREFNAMLTGKSWSDTPEGASKETIVKILESASPTVLNAAAMDVSDAAFEKLNDAVVTAATPAQPVIEPSGVKPAYTPPAAKAAAAHKGYEKVHEAKVAKTIADAIATAAPKTHHKPDGQVSPAQQLLQKLLAEDELWNTEVVIHWLDKTLDAVLAYPGPLGETNEEFIEERLAVMKDRIVKIETAVDAKKGATVPDTIPDNWS